jgi:hypothetical protein
MKNVVLGMIGLMLLIFIAGCTKSGLGSNQSVIDIVSETPDYEEQQETAVETNVSEAVSEEAASDEVPMIYTKCRYSTILYGGCKWDDESETTFSLKVQNAGKRDIPGTWLYYYGDSGNVKTVKRPEEILSGGIKTYNLNYKDLVAELGEITRIEILPIEDINGTEYACYNMHIYTIPSAYCKPAEPTNVDEYVTGRVVN